MTEPPTTQQRPTTSPPTMRPDPAAHVIDATSFLGRVVGRILRLWLLFLVIVYHVVLSLLPSRWADGVRSSRTKLADFMAELSVLFFVAPRASLADHLWFVASIVLRPLARTVGPYERRCFSRACRLDPPPYGATVRHVDTVAVGDGQVLRGTLWLPTGAGERFPTVIVRSPYGAQCTWIEWGQIILAERGYAVLLQDTRGRFGSDGMFVPIEQERDDGAATVAWVRQQPWCDGRVGVFGGSYLGLTAWAAVGASPPGAVQACVPVITQASIHSAIHGHGDAGGFSLELITYWFLLIDLVALAPTPLRLCVALLKALRDRPLTKAQGHTPLLELDEVLLGRRWPFYRDAISAPDADGPFWSERSTLCELRAGRPGAVVPPPLHLVSGWHDFFLPQALRDFEAAAAAQPDARLTVGPWDHWGQIRLLGQQHMLRAALGCLDANLRPAAPPRALPPLPTYDDGGRAAEEVGRAVQLCLVGSNRWVGLRAWPPPDAPPPTPLYLGSGGALRWEAAPVPPSRVEYTYDPARPTPSAGGPSFNPLNAGARSQRAIERRPDVLVFTSPPLAAAAAIVGKVRLVLRASCAAPSIDLVGRLCLVGGPALGGGAVNLVEGALRLHRPADGDGAEVAVELGPIAAEVPAGARVRLHVCSAAHPRWMRNLCDDPAVALCLQREGEKAAVGVWVDDDASRLLLPIVEV